MTTTQPDSMTKDEGLLSAAIKAVAKIEMDREGYPLSRTQEEIYEDAAETVQAVLALLPTPSSADNALRAMEIACRAVEQYGEGDEQEAQAARLGNLWKDHPAYQAALAALSPSSGEPASVAVEAAILKGVGKINGDGWKDTTRKGEIVFVWNQQLQPPYAAGQYPRVGNEIWSASNEQYDFTPATVDDVRELFAALSNPTPVEAGALRETCEHLESQLDLGHATIFLTPGKARTILAALSQPSGSGSDSGGVEA